MMWEYFPQRRKANLFLSSISGSELQLLAKGIETLLSKE